MSIKPSEALVAMYKKDCREACAKYRYWWSYKAAAIASFRWDLSQCIEICVDDSLKEEKASFCNRRIKKSE